VAGQRAAGLLALPPAPGTVVPCKDLLDVDMLCERRDGTCRLRIVDDPIFREFSFARLVLDQVQDQDARIILDVSLVNTLHSPGLANLVSIHVSLQKRGKELQLTGVNPHNLRLLRATRLDQLLTIV
jgi:anti-anti-sigma factor